MHGLETTTTTPLEERIALPEGALPTVTAERDRLRASYEQLRRYTQAGAKSVHDVLVRAPGQRPSGEDDGDAVRY